MYNAGIEPDKLDLNLESFEAKEARVVVDAKYARSKHWKERFGESMGEKGEENWLRVFFSNPFRKRSAEVNTRNVSAFSSQANMRPAARTKSPMPRIGMGKKSKEEKAKGEQEDKEDVGGIIADIEDKNEKMVAIIKMVNKELAEFIEKEGRMIMVRKSVQKNETSAEERERVLEREIGNNEDIMVNLRREIDSLKNSETRVAREG